QQIALCLVAQTLQVLRVVIVVIGEILRAGDEGTRRFQRVEEFPRPSDAGEGENAPSGEIVGQRLQMSIKNKPFEIVQLWNARGTLGRVPVLRASPSGTHDD